MKQMIEKELIAALQNTINEGKFKIKKYKFNDTYESIRIDKIDVVKTKDSCYLNLPSDVNKQYMTDWHHDIGHYLLRDLKRTSGQNVFEVTTKNTKTLLLLLPLENIEEYNEAELNHLQIGDNRYMILKSIPASETYTRYDEFSKNVSDEEFEEECMSNIISEEDIDPSLLEPDVESTALF